ncbi:MAG TPA: hypothetical protein VMT39_02545 [Candidatus Bathyarchaeia archaeon]|nr:hypothetical protein [Candidatus Bathyarchaeia archaeon]
MAFFRLYLVRNHQAPDTTFDERDEAALVYFLLQARLKGSAEGVSIDSDFQAPADTAWMPPAPDLEAQIKFVAAFLCFFVSKPMAYMNELQAFRQYFIPGFAADSAKQIQLGRALRAPFFTAGVEDLASASSLDLLFDVDEMSARAMAHA